jgi:hypothetical protein
VYRVLLQQNRRLVRENRSLRAAREHLQTRMDALILDEKLLRAEMLSVTTYA